MSESSSSQNRRVWLAAAGFMTLVCVTAQGCVRAEVAARERVTVPLDAPLVSAVPTRAFGRATQPDDRVVLLACRKA